MRDDRISDSKESERIRDRQRLVSMEEKKARKELDMAKRADAASPTTYPWDEMSEQVRVLVLELLCQEGTRSWTRERLDLGLFPAEDVVRMILFHRATKLGENFKAFIKQELDSLATIVIDALEAGTRASAARKYSTLIEGYTNEAYGMEEYVQVRRNQILACVPDLFEGIDLEDEINQRWLKLYLDHPEVREWLLNEAHKWKYQAWGAQKILGVALCPMCGKVQEREVATFPEICADCSADLEEGEWWCQTCQCIAHWTEDDMPSCDCS